MAWVINILGGSQSFIEIISVVKMFFLGWLHEIAKQKISEIMLKFAINVCEFASKWRSYGRRFFQSRQLFTMFFFHILSFFGVAAIFNSVFFRKFKDFLNYTISILILNRCKALYRKWQYARRHKVLTSFLM